MERRILFALCCSLIIASTMFNACRAGELRAEELLVNGDFEIGTPTDDKAGSFNCRGWRRYLWREDACNSWLTDDARDWQIGKANQSLEYRWGATSVCQYFSASPNEEYRFSVDFLNPGVPDTRWQPRIQVEWYDSTGNVIGQVVTVAEADYAMSPVKQWNALTGSVSSPAGTAYGRVLLNVNDKGSGQYFQKTYLDNASVQGKPGTHNLPVSFVSSPYDMALDAVFESEPFSDTLTNYATDKDGDRLTFRAVSAPGWLAIEPNGRMSGTPRFEDAGDNKLVVTVADGRGTIETRTITIPVIGYLRLGQLFDDDMVWQREASIPIWGEALPNEPVAIRMSTGETATAMADENGDWSTVLPPMQATTSGPVTMSVVSGDRELSLKNLLIGDVWMCSGQSNMAWPLEHTDQAAQDIAEADCPQVRLVTTPDTRDTAPWSDLASRAEWLECKPANVSKFSAVGYYFGRKLQEELKIPIGLISSNQGGTRIENWAVSLLPEGAETFYNSRIHPYTRMPVKGVIWYQAEANIADGASYTPKMQTLVDDWRKAWKSDLPFYFVQLAPFNYRGDAEYQLPEIWAAQTTAARKIANCEMAVINDIGNIDNIHPTNKQPVGERLALLALHHAYAREDLLCAGPTVKCVTCDGSTIRVAFDNVGGGLTSRDGRPLAWFEVAGADRKFVRATASIDGETVLISSKEIEQPRYVRFAWHETAQPNLMNVEGFPANAFVGECEGEQ